VNKLQAEQAAEKLGNGALGVELDVRDESSVDRPVNRRFMSGLQRR
jgi:hypothetical protein